MKLGIISDTHHYLNPKVSDVFKGVELIIHAGDVGSGEIMTQLRTLAPVVAVRGNMDLDTPVRILPAVQNIDVEGLQILVVHDIGDLNSFHRRIKRGVYFPMPEIVIFGHTHRALYKRLDTILYINPGSATTSRDSRKPSVMILEIDNRKVSSHLLIEL